MEFGDILKSFANAKQVGGSQWRADCPACGDKKGHLYISRVPDGKILLDCKKGCSFNDIIAAAGIKASDCFGESPVKQEKWKLIREHFYTDVNGNILGKKQIYDTGGGKKTGIWYRLEKGQYIKGLDGKKMPLYHLDKLIKAGNTAVIVEGEKDVETMERLGYTATTSPNGAGSKWRSDFNEFFRGKNVVVITDNDDAGEKYGANVCECVSKTAAAVKLIPASKIYPSVKEKGDISDIAAELGDDKTRELLIEAVKNTDAFSPAPKAPAKVVFNDVPENETLREALMKIRPEARFSPNDRGNGELFAEVFKDKARYCVNAKEWYVYKDGYWQQDAGNMLVSGFAKDLYDALLLYASDLPDGAKTHYIDHVNKMGKLNVRENMIKDARDRNFIKAEEFDSDQWLFNCRNGTYDLKNGYIRRHSPKDLISKMSNVYYDECADSPDFEKFLKEVMSNDGDKMRYLLTALGYALTGDCAYECMFILHGKTTRNGKSTLIETISYLMGGEKGYTRTINPETLVLSKFKSGNQASSDIARLHKARFVSCSEPDKGMVLDSGKLKQLTGNDTVTARYMYKDDFEFQPEFKLFMNTNWLPHITDSTVFDSGRVNVITFDRHFSADEQDRTLKARLRSDENISGIFNMLLRGLENYKRNGLKRPESVSAASAEYERSSDRQGMFISECLEADPNSSVTAKQAYALYLQWCRDNNYRAENKGNFIAGLRNKNMISPQKYINGTTYHNVIYGYRIAYDYQTEDEPVPWEEAPL